MEYLHAENASDYVDSEDEGQTSDSEEQDQDSEEEDEEDGDLSKLGSQFSRLSIEVKDSGSKRNYSGKMEEEFRKNV